MLFKNKVQCLKKHVLTNYFPILLFPNALVYNVYDLTSDPIESTLDNGEVSLPF